MRQGKGWKGSWDQLGSEWGPRCCRRGGRGDLEDARRVRRSVVNAGILHRAILCTCLRARALGNDAKSGSTEYFVWIKY